jgi:hypothetical protein
MLLAAQVLGVGTPTNAEVRDGEQPTADLPEYAFRGVAYGAAGWSMSALASRDPLLWDYVEVLKASPGTRSAVKKELAYLFTNPAFRYQSVPDNK